MNGEECPGFMMEVQEQFILDGSACPKCGGKRFEVFMLQESSKEINAEVDPPRFEYSFEQPGIDKVRCLACGMFLDPID